MNRPALVLTGVDSFVVEQRPPAESTGDAVAIDVDLVGLCGTDLHIVEGSHPRARFPLVLGHELVGRATAGQLAGRAVVVDPLIACGDCSACRLGERHVCANLRLIGIDRDGGLSGRVVVDSERVHVVPAGLDPVVAAMAEPLGVAVHATRRAHVGVGDTIVIMGAGPIGLLLAFAARHVGAATILIGETAPARRTFAESLGFDTLDTVDPFGDLERHTSGRLADVAFDAAAVPAVAALLPRLVPAGRAHRPSAPCAARRARPPGHPLQGTDSARQSGLPAGRHRRGTPDAGGRPGGFRPLISEVVGLDEAPAAFARLRAGEESVPRRDGWALMRALVKTTRGVGHLALQERPEPEAVAGWVKIAVRYAGICGTDLHVVQDEFPYWPPVTLGHEFTGTVVELGGGVDPAWLGARVVSEPHSLACGTCHLCRRGFAELCASKRSPGWGIDGAFADRLTMPVHLLHRVPAGLPDRVAALAEPMAVSVTALARAGVQAGDVVLIVGPGPIGILLAAGALAMGAATVVVAGRRDSDRLRFAGTMGALTVLDDSAVELIQDQTAGRGADLVIDATGTAEAIDLALRAVRRRGRFAAVGMSGQPVVRVPWDLAVSQAVDATFSMSSNGTAWAPAITILERTPQLEGMSTVFPLGDWEAAFEAVRERTVIKALLDPTTGAGR